LRQRCEQRAPLPLDAVPVLRDQAREERREAGEPGRRVADDGERDPEKDVRILLRDARIASLGLGGAARREPATAPSATRAPTNARNGQTSKSTKTPVPAGMSR
jgi:hypothetical protein